MNTVIDAPASVEQSIETAGIHALFDGLVGKTIQGVRPTHDAGPTPEVVLMFTDGTTFKITVAEGVFFEGCLINTLRKAKPVTDVIRDYDGASCYTIELWSRSFPLLRLIAVNKTAPADQFPFDITAIERQARHS